MKDSRGGERGERMRAREKEMRTLSLRRDGKVSKIPITYLDRTMYIR